MARTPRKTKVAFDNKLLAAMQFVGSVLKDEGSPNETHLLLSNGWAIAFNGIVGTGTSIDSNLYCAPNYKLLEKALAKCSEGYTIEQDGTNLIIKSGKFKAIVPCIDPSLIWLSGIDTNVAPITDAFKVALEHTGALASENGQKIHYASILMNGQSLVASENGVVLLEYWHGCNLPTDIAIPKALVAPLTKTLKRLVGFGYSDTSVTFHYEDGSFIKSQLFSEKWPNISSILEISCNPSDPPKDLWEGLNAVAPHSVDNLIYFDNNVIRSCANDSVGASYEVKGLPRGPIFNIKHLQILKEYGKKIDFFAQGPNGNLTLFYGDNCRGAIAGRS